MRKNFVMATLIVFLGFEASAAVEKYKLDPAHTAVVFKVSHLGFSHTYGMFTATEGTLALDEAKPEASSVELKIKTDSLVTHEVKRDQHLKGPDFFNVKANPLITFKSKMIKKVGANSYKVDGDLSLNGVTKSITLDLTRNRTGKGMQGETRTGGDLNFKIKRSDFNMKYMNGPDQIGDEVELMVSVEAIRE